jgi:hypothetical protein
VATVRAHTLLTDAELREVRAAFKVVDEDGNGAIDRDEFVNAVMSVSSAVSRERLKQVFDDDVKGSREPLIDYKHFVALLTPIFLGCDESGLERGGGGGEESSAAMDSRKDLTWRGSWEQKHEQAAAARQAARAAIADTLKPPTIKVIKEIPVDSKQSVERVVRLEAKVSPACRV